MDTVFQPPHCTGAVFQHPQFTVSVFQTPQGTATIGVQVRQVQDALQAAGQEGRKPGAVRLGEQVSSSKEAKKLWSDKERLQKELGRARKGYQLFLTAKINDCIKSVKRRQNLEKELSQARKNAETLAPQSMDSVFQLPQGAHTVLQLPKSLNTVSKPPPPSHLSANFSISPTPLLPFSAM